MSLCLAVIAVLAVAAVLVYGFGDRLATVIARLARRDAKADAGAPVPRYDNRPAGRLWSGPRPPMLRPAVPVEPPPVEWPSPQVVRVTQLQCAAEHDSDPLDPGEDLAFADLVAVLELSSTMPARRRTDRPEESK